jgi:hypothetical protein
VWEKGALAAWLLVLGVVCVRAVVWPHTHSLYPIFADAARHWCAGESLYRHAAPAAGGLDVYRYSPLVAGLLTPLTVLPDPAASALWRLLNAAGLLAGLAWFCRAALPCRLSRNQRGVLFLLVLPLAVGNLNNAQSNPLVLGLVLGTVAAAAEGRWNRAAGCMALAGLFKIYPLAVGLLLAGLYPRQFLARLAAGLAVGLALPFLLQNPDYVAAQYASWLEYLGTDDRSGFPLATCYRDFQLVCRLWAHPLSPRAYQVLQVLVGAAIALLCWRRCHAGMGRRRLLNLLLGLGCCWMTVFGPATESATYVLLAPSLAWALVEAWSAGRPPWVRGWRAAVFGLLAATYMSCWFPGGARLQAFGLQPLAGLMLFADLLGGQLRREHRRPQVHVEPTPSPPARAA